ncbi:MAG TPA: hypothetical protein VKQ52_16485 [Puia sp.]|nr:hypothetical protein [Puia sp.]
MKKLSVKDIETFRGELFHMILFSMAWCLIGEYVLDFRDYAVGLIVVLIAVVWLALYSIRLYDLEGALGENSEPAFAAGTDVQRRRDRQYALILLFEGIAVLLTWSILLKHGRDNWVIPSFAFIAGLHFFPLARVIRLPSYYYLGAWICLLTVAGYLLFASGRLEDRDASALIAYGCAAGSVLDGIVIVFRVRRELDA